MLAVINPIILVLQVDAEVTSREAINLKGLFPPFLLLNHFPQSHSSLWLLSRIFFCLHFCSFFHDQFLCVFSWILLISQGPSLLISIS